MYSPKIRCIGIGLSARSVEKGGCDLIIIYNSGRFRMAARGSLAGLMPYGDANQIVVEMVCYDPILIRPVMLPSCFYCLVPAVHYGVANRRKEGGKGFSDICLKIYESRIRKLRALQASEILPVVENTGVLAGVCASDPFRIMPQFLRQIKDLGFCGVQNFPTVGLIDGTFRQNLEETGMGYDKEVDMIRAAHELDLLTTPYVFTVEDGEKMTRAGADVLVCHAGLTTSGAIGAVTARSLDDCVSMIQNIRDAAVKINPDIIVLCHGGPIAEPKDAEYVLNRTKGVHGFFGASSMERLPVEIAIKENAQTFKNLKLQK